MRTASNSAVVSTPHTTPSVNSSVSTHRTHIRSLSSSSGLIPSSASSVAVPPPSHAVLGTASTGSGLLSSNRPQQGISHFLSTPPIPGASSAPGAPYASLRSPSVVPQPSSSLSLMPPTSATNEQPAGTTSVLIVNPEQHVLKSAASSSGSGGLAALDVRALSVCVAYCALSAVCVLHNKFVLSYVFPSENALLLAQNIFTIVFLCVVSSRTVQHSPIAAIRNLYVNVTLYRNPGDWTIGVCYSLCVVTGIWSLNYLSVPMFSSLKRCNIVVVWLVEFAVSRNETTMKCLWPTILFVVGTALMSYYDLQFSALGYLFGGMSCVLQSVSFELGKRLVNHGKDLWSVLLINALASTVIQVLFMAATGEAQSLFIQGSFRLPASATIAHVEAIKEASETPSHIIVMHLLMNGAMIMALNYSIFLNCSVNSPLAHTVTGNMKSVLTILSGIAIFAVPLRPMAVVGIVLGLIAGAWFSWVKFQSQLEAKRQQRKTAAVTAEKLGSTSQTSYPSPPNTSVAATGSSSA